MKRAQPPKPLEHRDKHGQNTEKVQALAQQAMMYSADDALSLSNVFIFNGIPDFLFLSAGSSL